MNLDFNRDTAEYHSFNVFAFLYKKKNGAKVYAKHPMTIRVLGDNRGQAFGRAKNMAKDNLVLAVA